MCFYRLFSISNVIFIYVNTGEIFLGLECTGKFFSFSRHLPKLISGVHVSDSSPTLWTALLLIEQLSYSFNSSPTLWIPLLHSPSTFTLALLSFLYPLSLSPPLLSLYDAPQSTDRYVTSSSPSPQAPLLYAVMLAMWYLRYEYGHLFNTMSTIILLFLTALLLISTYLLYITQHVPQTATAAAATPVSVTTSFSTSSSASASPPSATASTWVLCGLSGVYG